MSNKNDTIKVRLTFTEDLLGTASNDPDLHGSYVASKAPDAMSMEEEIAAVGLDDVIERGMTVFPRDKDGKPVIFDYQIKGFFKDAAGVLRKVPGTKASKVKAYKKEIDGLLFVSPRMIPLQMSGPMGECQRPLRASTPQGERVALAHSEAAPAGTTIEFEIECMTEDMYELAKECLGYGEKRGLGQWRNSGKGRFTWELVE